MRELILARHGESELSVLERLNGDPSLDVRLTELGREQARELGRSVGEVDLVAHTSFVRTRETAELAWPGAPLLELPELNEFGFGSFEGSRWTDGFDKWVVASGPEDPSPGGGESRVAAVERFVRGYRVLLARPEERVALVAHGATVRYALLALDGAPPARVLEGVDPGRPFVVDADELARAAEFLDAWVATPVF
ncbi:MAG: histidine phosphatase family protein [Actinobacteria bacterium]|nr:histidine phosphatase family protein [Actinomycetota bacterium]